MSDESDAELPGLESDDGASAVEPQVAPSDPISGQAPPHQTQNSAWKSGRQFDTSEYDIGPNELFDSSNAKRARWGTRESVVAAAALLGVVVLGYAQGWLSAGEESGEFYAQLAAEELEEEEVAGLTEAVAADDVEAIVANPQFFDCPIGFQLDVIGRLVSGEEGETSEHVAETAIEKGSGVACTSFDKRSYVFTMIVEGDGETLATADDTFYEVLFVVNNQWPNNVYYDDTGFDVFVRWNHIAQEYGVTLTDANRAPLTGFEAEVQWLDSSTLEVHVTIPEHDVEVANVRTELFVYATDDDGQFLYRHRDIAGWSADLAAG